MSNIGNKETFGKNLKYYIEKKGITQKELAEVVGVASSTLNDWIKAKKYPRMDKVEILANYFGILKSDLIEEKQKQSTDGELSMRKKQFIRKVEGMSDDQIARLEQILSLVENTEI
jgi:transcriptional regulator with XRE-family HTH domain